MFITFEGGEGSGKSTAIKKVKKMLEDYGKVVLLTREPGGTPIGEDIRNILLDKKNTMMDKRTEALLYAASRRQHLIEKIWPAIKEGKIVICDRYLDSSLAYQGGARDLGIDNVLNINLFATEGTYPNITFLFDLDPEVGLSRIKKNNRIEDRLDLETLDFHKKVRASFLLLASKYKDRFIIINANKSSDEIAEEVFNHIIKRFK